MQKISPGFQELPDREIERMVEGLDSLLEGDLGVATLVACGERAIPALRRFLLHGKPSTVFAGRQRAVKALSELGAFLVLLEYFTAPKSIEDPALRYSEEAIENTAARELAKWRTDEVFAALLQILRHRALPGAIEAIASFERCESIPLLISALEDDVGRPAAKDALQRLRPLAISSLIETVRSPEPSASHESPSSLLRRRSALQILREGPLTVADWEPLRFLLYESDPAMAVLASCTALQLGVEPDQRQAIVIAIDALGSRDWTVVAEAEEALVQNLRIARAAIEREIWKCLSSSDPVHREKLRLLYAIVRKGQKHCGAAI